MGKVQTPCVVCKALIYAPVNMGLEAAVCVSCKRQGESPGKKRLGRCSECKIKLTDDRISTRAGLCIFCYAKMIESELKRAEAELEEKRMVIAHISSKADEEMTFPDTASFGGYAWGNAVVNPVG